MKKMLFFFLAVFILNPYYGYSQKSNGVVEDFNEGQYFFNRKDYADAVLFYMKLLEKDSMHANYNFKVGQCYLNIRGKEHLAVKYFERASANVVPKKKYNNNDPLMKSAPLHTFFYLGNAYRMNNQLNEALTVYFKFIDAPYFWNNYNLKVVEREIKSCERAKIIQDSPLEYIKINLGENINSLYNDINPVVSGDGRSMVFTRQLKFYNAIYYSTAGPDGWAKAVNINPQVLSDGDFYPTGLSFNGNQLLLIKQGAEENDIYISQLVKGVWTAAQKLPGPINSNSDESFASFGPDDKIIFLSSNRKKSRGGYDIFVSMLSSDGKWCKPKNLGKTINTSFDEKNPMFSSLSNSLFFSSNSHYNMGGYDIFYSKLEDEKWQIPINIGFPINDTRDNLWFCPSSQYREGFYVFPGTDSSSQDDIYHVKIISESVLNFDRRK